MDRDWTESGGQAAYARLFLVGELAQVPHFTRRRRLPRVAIYLHIYLPLAGVRSSQHAHVPVLAAAGSALATGATGYIGTQHVSSTWKLGELKIYFYQSAEGLKT